jgi:GNAT superfamily N-acetyltransferase
MIEVRRATPADVPRLASAFARAFLDDPLMTWVVPDEDRRLERLRRFFAYGLGRMVTHNIRDVYTTTNAAGAATWAQPGEWKLPARKMLPAVHGVLRAIGPGGLMRIGRAHTFLESKHPHEPHAYLEGLATDPNSQGKGIGSALIQVVLVRCDEGQLPAYLTTQNPDNVPFYRRHGFDVTGEVDIPGGGPHMWLMWREPKRLAAASIECASSSHGRADPRSSSPSGPTDRHTPQS